MELLTVSTQAPAIMPERIEDLIKAFINDQDVKANSKRAYMGNLAQYFAWIRGKGYDLATVSRPEILQYKDELLRSGKSTLTVSSYLSAVRRFYEWAETHKLYPNIAKGIRPLKDKRAFRKEPLTLDQTVKFIKYFQDKAFGINNAEALQPISESNRRDYAVMLMLVSMGLRTVEVIRADVEDIQYKAGKNIIYIQGKGWEEKNAVLVLSERVHSAIRTYLATRGNPSRGPLFLSTSNNNNGERLTTRTISYIAKEGLRAIGIDDKAITAHSLRHTAAVNILRSGGSLADAQGMLRHADISTTMLYTATINEEMRLKHSGEDMLDKFYTQLLSQQV